MSKHSFSSQKHPATGISVVIPVYRSEQILPKLVQRLCAVLDELPYIYEIILVNDGSPDNSWKIIKQLSEQYLAVQGICLLRNYGQHNALLCGIRAARYDVTITMDDDLQHPPNEIPRLLEKLNEGYDVVYGYPESEGHQLWRALASRITKTVLQNVMGVQEARYVSAFRALRTRIRNAFETYTSPYVTLDVLLSWGTRRFTHVLVENPPRLQGESNYTVGKLIRYALTMITGFSIVPLRIASIMGFGFVVFSMVLFMYIILRFLIERIAPPGFTFLASTIILFSGVQLFAIGIIGEYLARMHLRLMDQPAYVVAENWEDLS